MFELSPSFLHERDYQGAQTILIIIIWDRQGHKELRVVHKSFQIVPRILILLLSLSLETRMSVSLAPSCKISLVEGHILV